MPPGTSEVPHFHRRAQQFFFILAGVATMRIEGADQTLIERSGIDVPAGVVHQMRNDSDRDVEFLVISMPSSHGDRVNIS